MFIKFIRVTQEFHDFKSYDLLFLYGFYFSNHKKEKIHHSNTNQPNQFRDFYFSRLNS